MVFTSRLDETPPHGLGDTPNAEQSFSRLNGGVRMKGAGPLMNVGSLGEWWNGKIAHQSNKQTPNGWTSKWAVQRRTSQTCATKSCCYHGAHSLAHVGGGHFYQGCNQFGPSWNHCMRECPCRHSSRQEMPTSGLLRRFGWPEVETDDALVQSMVEAIWNDRIVADTRC